MKQNIQKLLALTLTVLLLTALLAGCGAKTESAQQADAPEAPAAADTAMDYGTTEEKSEMAPEAPAEPQAGENLATGGGAAIMTDPSQKIIYRAFLQVETTTFDEAVAATEKLTSQYGGFFESATVDGSTSYGTDGTARVVDRYAHYVIRIPAAQYSAALKQAGTIGNVISTNQSTENITSQFIDSEARQESLEIQEKRLLSMLEKTTDMESLVALESRLSELRYEIESIERQLRNWQTMVSYSTIELNLREVEVYTPTLPIQRTFGQRISDAFSDGLQSFSRAMQHLAIGIVGSLPVLLLLAALAVGTFLVVRRVVRKRKATKQPPVQNTEPPESK